MIKKIIKNWYLFVPTILLLIGMNDLVYGYYQFLRITITVFAIFFVSIFKEKENKTWVFLMIITAILFNPIFSIHLNKDNWVVLDFICSIIFLVFSINIISNKHIIKK